MAGGDDAPPGAAVDGAGCGGAADRRRFAGGRTGAAAVEPLRSDPPAGGCGVVCGGSTSGTDGTDGTGGATEADEPRSDAEAGGGVGPVAAGWGADPGARV